MRSFLFISLLVLGCSGEPFSAGTDNALAGGSGIGSSSSTGWESADPSEGGDSSSSASAKGGEASSSSDPMSGEGGAPSSSTSSDGGKPSSMTTDGGSPASAGDGPSAAGGSPEPDVPCADGIRFRANATDLAGTPMPVVNVEVSLESKPFKKFSMVTDDDADPNVFDGCLTGVVVAAGDEVLFTPHTGDGASPCTNDQSVQCGLLKPYSAWVYGKAAAVSAVCRTACKASSYWALGATYTP
jgi:hypothetical protein